MMRRWMVVLFFAMLGASGLAELRFPAVFSDGMVLQREQEVAVWGWADPGAEVKVSFADQQRSAKAGQDGMFMVRLQKMDANAQPQNLKAVSGRDSAEVRNVLVGEVWLCSGQSNMEFLVSKADNFAVEKAAANHPLIRMFITQRNVGAEPLPDCTGGWKVCAPETVGGFSAAAYFFGREIQQALDVPVGLIHTSWGGTRIEAWSPMASLDRFPAVAEYKAGEDAKSANYDAAAAQALLAKQQEEWNAKAEQAQAAGKKAPRRPQLQIDPKRSQNYPANLYNAMIHPFVPYGLRGAIWYQGEANTRSIEQAILYRALLENMVAEWRKDWGGDFPFYAVQLVNFKKPQTQPVEDTAWAFIRESFLKFHKDVPHAGIAVGIDVGMADNIHPTNKQAIGLRLARQALAKTYKLQGVAGGPIYRSMQKEDGKIVLRFDDIGSGLKNDAPLKTFAIAGADRKFVWAQAVIEGDAVAVHSPEVADPVAVRYAWADNPVGCNLCNQEGFPASPFRTDDWAPTAE